jgi:hypothetical protein
MCHVVGLTKFVKFLRDNLAAASKHQNIHHIQLDLGGCSLADYKDPRP